MAKVARTLLRGLAVTYLAGVLLNGVGSGIPTNLVPPALNFFMQVAALFPRAAAATADYRAEGWVCSERAWRELDTRAYFPIDPDDKENRFQRAMSFYRDEEAMTDALEAYLVDKHNAGAGDDGIARAEPIGGVRLVRVRIPTPTTRDRPRLERVRRRPLADFGEGQRRVVFAPPASKLEERCGAPPAPAASGR